MSVKHSSKHWRQHAHAAITGRGLMMAGSERRTSSLPSLPSLRCTTKQNMNGLSCQTTTREGEGEKGEIQIGVDCLDRQTDRQAGRVGVGSWMARWRRLGKNGREDIREDHPPRPARPPACRTRPAGNGARTGKWGGNGGAALTTISVTVHLFCSAFISF